MTRMEKKRGVKSRRETVAARATPMMRLAALALLSSTHAQRLVLDQYTDVGEQDLNEITDLDDYTEELAADSGDAYNWALYVQALHAGLKTRNTSILGRPSAFIDAGRGPFGPQEHLAKEVFFARVEHEAVAPQARCQAPDRPWPDDPSADDGDVQLQVTALYIAFCTR